MGRYILDSLLPAHWVPSTSSNWTWIGTYWKASYLHTGCQARPQTGHGKAHIGKPLTCIHGAIHVPKLDMERHILDSLLPAHRVPSTSSNWTWKGTYWTASYLHTGCHPRPQTGHGKAHIGQPLTCIQGAIHVLKQDMERHILDSLLPAYRVPSTSSNRTWRGTYWTASYLHTVCHPRPQTGHGEAHIGQPLTCIQFAIHVLKLDMERHILASLFPASRAPSPSSNWTWRGTYWTA